MSGGRTRDGGSMIGGSVFYADEAREVTNAKSEVEDAVEHLDKELQENEQRQLEAEQLEQQLSSLVWICTSTQKMSKVTVIDANNPAEILEVFNVCQSHLLCIASVPGATESDYVSSSDVDASERPTGDENGEQAVLAKSVGEQKTDENADPEAEQNATEQPQSLESVDSESVNFGKVQFVKSTLDETSGKEQEAQDNKAQDETPIEKMSSVQPTMWLGAQNGAVFVHSAVAKWSVCLHNVTLKDAILSIV